MIAVDCKVVNNFMIAGPTNFVEPIIFQMSKFIKLDSVLNVQGKLELFGMKTFQNYYFSTNFKADDKLMNLEAFLLPRKLYHNLGQVLNSVKHRFSVPLNCSFRFDWFLYVEHLLGNFVTVILKQTRLLSLTHVNKSKV